MANENLRTEHQGSGVARTAYRVTRTHEGPMGSLGEGYVIEIEDADPRAKGMLDAGLIEKHEDAEAAQRGGTAPARRGAAKNEAGSGDRAAKNG